MLDDSIFLMLILRMERQEPSILSYIFWHLLSGALKTFTTRISITRAHDRYHWSSQDKWQCGRLKQRLQYHRQVLKYKSPNLSTADPGTPRLALQYHIIRRRWRRSAPVHSVCADEITFLLWFRANSLLFIPAQTVSANNRQYIYAHTQNTQLSVRLASPQGRTHHHFRREYVNYIPPWTVCTIRNVHIKIVWV